MEIRPFDPAELAAVTRLVAACWPDDPTMRELHGIHGRGTRTLVAMDDDEVVGAATVREGRFHPTRTELVVTVDPARRRRGIASALLAPLAERADRPFLARTRPGDEGGQSFLRAHGFRVVMRNRVALVDPMPPLTTDERGLEVRAGDMPAEEAAEAIEKQYRVEHSLWAPAGEWSLKESVEVFCGPFWVRDSTVAAYRNGDLVGISVLYGEPIAQGPDELYLSHTGPLDLADPDADRITRALVARQLAFAGNRGVRVRFEADEANAPLWLLLDELAIREEARLLLLANRGDK